MDPYLMHHVALNFRDTWDGENLPSAAAPSQGHSFRKQQYLCRERRHRLTRSQKTERPFTIPSHHYVSHQLGIYRFWSVIRRESIRDETEWPGADSSHSHMCNPPDSGWRLTTITEARVCLSYYGQIVILDGPKPGASADRHKP